MSKTLRNAFLNRVLKGGACIFALFAGAVIFYSTTAESKVCFLPGGLCPGELNSGSVVAVQGDQCLGYNLTQRKCSGQACEEGWECESCENGQGKFWKCTKKPTPASDECGGDPNKAWEPGLEECTKNCQRYDYCSFTGNKINGKCTSIPDYTDTKPAACNVYIKPNYVYAVSIEGSNVIDQLRNNCYTDIKQMVGYSTNKPASCHTYNSRRDGLQSSADTMCYTAGVSIGDYYTTTKRNEDIFQVQTEYGVDTFIDKDGKETKTNTEACYRAVGCNASNGWLPPDQVDGKIFEYKTETSDGIICRKAIGCKESENWFNHEKLGQYNNIYFALRDESINIGNDQKLHCYKAESCYNKAYSTQPDSRYFKFDKKTSNGHDCWIVTGKADYAYNAGDKKTTYFDYTSATAYLNGTDTQVTYYIVNKDNSDLGGHDGCMKYAYESIQDTRYFSNASEEQYLNGSSSKKKCWNVTGIADYAYNAGERKTNFFDYTSDTRYLNGTATQGTYYIVDKNNGRNGCMQYAYESQPDVKYFSTVSEEQYSDGSATLKKCWNITGKGEYAYKASEKNTKYFTYDNGKEGYLNGTSATERYYDITSCGTYAYTSEPDTTYFSSASKTEYKGGIKEPSITCWNVTDKAAKAYYSAERILTHFSYNESIKVYLNGENNQITYFQAKSCATKAYDSVTDTTHFAYDSGKKQYYNGVGDLNTCYNVTGCGIKAKTTNSDTDHFT